MEEAKPWSYETDNCSTPAIVPDTPPKLVVSLIIAWIHSLSTPLRSSTTPISILLIWGQTMAYREKKKADPPKTMKNIWRPFSLTFRYNQYLGPLGPFFHFLSYFFDQNYFFKWKNSATKV